MEKSDDDADVEYCDEATDLGDRNRQIFRVPVINEVLLGKIVVD